MEKEHGTDWVTVTVCPATLKLPVLGAPVVLGYTKKVTVVLPLPVYAEVISIQLSFLITPQGQLLPVLSDTLPSAEYGPKANEVGLTE